MSIFEDIKQKRAARKDLRQRRQRLLETQAAKIEKRRAKAEERRKSIHRRKGDKARLRELEELTPQTPEREAAIIKKENQLKREIDQLHTEIGQDTDRIEELDAQLAKIATRVEKAKAKTEELTKQIRKLVRKAQKKSGADKALERAKKDDGKHEEPPGSNWGGVVTKMIQFTGYGGPVYWCGCAAAWWTIKYGGASAAARIRRGYAGFVEADARANTNGLRAVPEPAKGGIASLWDNEHIVVTTGATRVYGGVRQFETAEGNTSDTTGGSQSNGDSCSYGKWRNFYDADVFAACDYPDD